MAIKNTKLGGTDWDDEILFDIDLNDTNNALITKSESSERGYSELAFRTLEAAGSFNNSGSLAAEEFTTAAGTNGTVNTGSTDAVFDTDNYSLKFVRDTAIGTDTTLDPDAFSNPSNAFDDDTGTFAQKSLLNTNAAVDWELGKTFSSKFIAIAYVNFTFSDLAGPPMVKLETYNGTTWDLVKSYNNNGGNYDGTYAENVLINNTVQGIRLRFTSTVTGNGWNRYATVYELSYGGLADSTVVCDTNTLSVDSETSAFALFWEGSFPTNTSGSFDLSDGVNTVNYPVNSVTGHTDVISKGAMTTVSDITIKANLATTDTAATPTIKGWGIKKVNN